MSKKLVETCKLVVMPCFILVQSLCTVFFVYFIFGMYFSSALMLLGLEEILTVRRACKFL